ncbi:hypothetical protein RN001_005797 [Aquatica leii]|uniref:THAP-type domain-containing protein n=1 Tax=Aquatica leii TaxID=1421715 RepID=A0AAN7SPZ0_9COLE|nr:hypothetical protein RN001_005797 [Aquatica leii]
MDKKKTKSKNNCCVPQCYSTYKSANVSLHNFLNDKFQHKQWVIALKMGKQVSAYMKVCNLHFNDEDFFFKGKYTCEPVAQVKTHVVPSQNLPVRVHDKLINEESVRQRSERAERRHNNRLVNRKLHQNNNIELAVMEEPCTTSTTKYEALDDACNLLLFKENVI